MSGLQPLTVIDDTEIKHVVNYQAPAAGKDKWQAAAAVTVYHCPQCCFPIPNLEKKLQHQDVNCFYFSFSR